MCHWFEINRIYIASHRPLVSIGDRSNDLVGSHIDRVKKSLLDTVLGLEPGVPGSIPNSGKNFVFRNTLIGFGSRDPPMKLSSVWGMRVQAESLPIMHPWKHGVKE